jgi:hypothetical protein
MNPLTRPAELSEWKHRLLVGIYKCIPEAGSVGCTAKRGRSWEYTIRDTAQARAFKWFQSLILHSDHSQRSILCSSLMPRTPQDARQPSSPHVPPTPSLGAGREPSTRPLRPHHGRMRGSHGRQLVLQQCRAGWKPDCSVHLLCWRRETGKHVAPGTCPLSQLTGCDACRYATATAVTGA